MVSARRVVAAVVVAAAAVAAVAACQGKREGGQGGAGGRPVEEDGAGAAGVGSDAAGSGAAGSGAAGAGSARTAPEEPEAPADPSKQIAELGAIPAWQAVVDRAQLLARRGQKGIVYGRVGPAVPAPPAPAGPASPAPAAPAPPAPAPPTPGSAGGSGAPADTGPSPSPPPPPPPPSPTSPYVWLVDDTEGHGSLGIRLALGKHTANPGDRIAASGAWELDEARRWYWKVDAVQPLAPAPPSSSAPPEPLAAVPSHVPPTGPLPPGARPIKQARDNDLVYFQLVGPSPAREGDGWQVAAELGDLPTALLILPGERPSYGGHDMRAADERWQLRRQQLYVVRLGKLRSQGAGKPFVVHARTGPVRVM